MTKTLHEMVGSSKDVIEDLHLEEKLDDKDLEENRINLEKFGFEYILTSLKKLQKGL